MIGNDVITKALQFIHNTEKSELGAKKIFSQKMEILRGKKAFKKHNYNK